MLAKELIAPFEGCHRVASDGLIWPYVCPAGYWTQGWGRRVFKGAPPQDKRIVDLWFIQDILIHEAYAMRLSPPLLRNERRLAAITSFIYNLGPGAYQASTLRKRVNEEDWVGAQREINRWVYGGGVKLPGLVVRRHVEGGILREG